MNEEHAFLAAIVAHPDEDTPRLAFADWLDEHGDPDRAAFIRLQIRDAHLELGSSERSDISRQTDRLFEANRDRWLADLPKSLGRHIPRYRFKRGFFTELHATGAQFARIPKRVWANHPIRELRLNEIVGRLDRVLAVPHLVHIRDLWLDFDNKRLTATDLSSLAVCPHLSGVRKLLVVRGDNPVAAALARCPSLRGLTVLDLYSNIDDKGMAALTGTGAENLRGLKRLWVRNTRFGPGTAVALARTPALAALEDLYVGFNNNRDGWIGDAGAAALAGSVHLTGLRTLRLDAQDVGPEGARALAASPHLTGLRILSLTGNRPGTNGVRALTNGPWTGLAALDLSRCDLGDGATTVLARSPRLTALTSLALESNRIGTKGAVALSQASGLAELVILNLNDNDIGDAGARALCESAALGNLRQLHAEPRNGKYSPAVEAALKRRFTDRVFGSVIQTFYTETMVEEVRRVFAANPSDRG